MKLSCNIPGIDPENNTLTKAYDLYNQYHSLDFGLDIRLIKGVPHGAGLGGGSANGAELLKYLQKENRQCLAFSNTS